MHVEIQMGEEQMRVDVGQCTQIVHISISSRSCYLAACSREMRRASTSSYSSSRRVSSSVGPRRKLRSALTKAAVSAAILQPRVP